ncbi:MAG: hypothetical protein Kow0069_38810 [Promethearchaeota archaeon]
MVSWSFTYWFAFSAWVAFSAFFLGRATRLKLDQRRNRWGRVLTSDLVVKEVELSWTGGSGKAWAYGSTDFPEDDPNARRMPGVLVLPRKEEKYPQFEHWGAHFALQGYPTLVADLSGKGGAPPLSSLLLPLSSLPRVDPESLVVLGMAESALIALDEGLDRPDVALVGGFSCPRADPSTLERHAGKGRVVLVHCADDQVATLEDFRANADALKLENWEYLLLKGGGHLLLGQEPSALAFFSIVMKKKLDPAWPQVAAPPVSPDIFATESAHALEPRPRTPRGAQPPAGDKDDVVGGLAAVNWSSSFLRKFLAQLLAFVALPHLLVWLPAWFKAPGWALYGSPALASGVLNLLHVVATIALLGWAVAYFDHEFNRWPVPVESDQVTFERVRIPVGGGHYLPGDLVKGPLTPATEAPVLIVCHGLGGQRTDYYPIGIPLSFLGFAVLFYDSRGHGEAKFGRKWDTGYIIRDFSRVVDFVEERARLVGDLDSSNVVAWGPSMGGGIVLNEAYLDHRVKFCIALCTWADFRATATRKMRSVTERLVKAMYEFMGINLDPTDLQNRLVSPILNSFNKRKGFFGHPVPWPVDNAYRVAGLAHCKDDQVVNYENFEQNRKFLGLPPLNCIAFERGNHAFAGNETALVGKMLLWFWVRGY